MKYQTPLLLKLQINRSVEVTGIDFTGALYVKDNGSEQKVYISLFTHATTCAVHLEVVLDLTLENFMLAFHKFTSCRSPLQQCYQIIGASLSEPHTSR